MNCEELIVPSLELSLALVKECMRCIIHTVLFGRSIGGDVPVDPVTVYSKVLSIKYCKFNETGMTDFSGIVEQKLKDFTRRLEMNHSMILMISFFVPRQRQSKSFWDILSTPIDDKAIFERWKIQVDLPEISSGASSPRIVAEEEQKFVESASLQIRERMMFIVRKICDRMDHLPPPPSDQIPYHFDITYVPSVPKSKSASPHSPNSSGTVTPQLMWSPKSLAQSIRSIPFIT